MLTISDIHTIFNLDSEGRLIWASGFKKGKLVGCAHSNSGYICTETRGKVYRVNQLLWAYHYGEWPTQPVRFIDGDRGNVRLSNLFQGPRPARASGVHTGDVFGNWTVNDIIEARLPSLRKARCTCSCGTQRVVRIAALLSGHSKSCGCLRPPVQKNPECASAHPLHHIWSGMIGRCHGKNPCRNYGQRGIVVCAEWRENFWAFAKDMGPRPSPEYSIDRINVNGNYEPSNCRWATKSEQSRNRRDSKYVKVGETIMSIYDAMEITGLKYQTIYQNKRFQI